MTIAAAEEQPMAVARLMAMDSALSGAGPALIERFGGEPAEVHAVFLIPANQAIRIVADLYLDGGKLGAVLAKDIRFDVAANPSNPALLEGVFTLPLPDAQKPVRLKVILRVQSGGQDGWTDVGEFRLRVIPKDLLRQALTKLTDARRQDPAIQIEVFGDVPGLRELLREWKVPFDDDGRDAPAKVASRVLAVGDALDAEHLPNLGENASLLLFHHDPGENASVVQKFTPTQTIILVNTPSREDWRRSPLLQRHLSEQIHRHLQEHE